jgi:hypothetical protein
MSDYQSKASSDHNSDSHVEQEKNKVIWYKNLYSDEGLDLVFSIFKSEFYCSNRFIEYIRFKILKVKNGYVLY